MLRTNYTYGPISLSMHLRTHMISVFPSLSLSPSEFTYNNMTPNCHVRMRAKVRSLLQPPRGPAKAHNNSNNNSNNNNNMYVYIYIIIICIYTYMTIYIYIYDYTYMTIYIYMTIHIWLYIYIYAYTHTYINPRRQNRPLASERLHGAERELPPRQELI